MLVFAIINKCIQLACQLALKKSHASSFGQLVIYVNFNMITGKIDQQFLEIMEMNLDDTMYYELGIFVKLGVARYIDILGKRVKFSTSAYL